MVADLNTTLIVGASGRVGRMLARGWAAAGWEPTLQYRTKAAGVVSPTLVWSPLAGPIPARHRFSAMIVLSGVVPGGGDLWQNAAIAEACVVAAAAAGIDQVLVASSSAVYGCNADGRAFGESDVTQPVNDYGRAKLAMEAQIAPWRARGMQICALRIGNVAGADALLLNVAKRQPVSLDQFADGGGPVRSYIGPLTMARVLAGLIGRDLPAVLNLAAPAPVGMADLAASAGADWHWRAAPETAYQRITLDCGRLAKFHDFDEADNRADAMVAEWRAVRDRE